MAFPFPAAMNFHAVALLAFILFTKSPPYAFLSLLSTIIVVIAGLINLRSPCRLVLKGRNDPYNGAAPVPHHIVVRHGGMR